MNKGLVISSLDALSGQSAGVQVISAGNQEAMVTAVRVRGTTSLTGGNDPLVIIDGVTADLATLSTVYPADIESFTILKDASETAQYGSPYVETAGARMKKYEVDPNATKDGKLMDNDIVLFRYADVLLMRAEALLRNGQADAGQPYFDAVRRRAFMPTRPLTLDNIYDERLLELCWEGWRRQDMIRFGRYASLSQNDGSGSNVDESDGHTTVYPIPADVLALNSNLRQNKGY